MLRVLKYTLTLTIGVLALSTTAAWAVGTFTNGVPAAGQSPYQSTIPLTGKEQLPADTELSGSTPPQSEAITTSQLAAFANAAGSPRNFLDNGAMDVAQQGTGAIAGGTTTIGAFNFAADRWFADANVASGAAYSQVITSPVPPTGFNQSLTVWRASGSLTQNVCLMQEIESSRARGLQGRNVVLSLSLRARSGLSSTNGAVTAYVIGGTGVDQGLATLTASPAITPAWTGIATLGSATFNLPVATPSWSRYYTGSIAIPSGESEVGVEVCFVPTGTGSSTDGFAMTGVQLEAVGSGTVGPSQFEFQPMGSELREAERFFWQLSEPGLGVPVPIHCQDIGNNVQSCMLRLPVEMRGSGPGLTISAAGTFKQNITGTLTTWVSPVAGLCSIWGCIINSSTPDTTPGNVGVVTGGGGSGVLKVSSGVVM